MTTQTDHVAPSRIARGTILAAASLTIMAPALVAPSLPTMQQVFAAEPGVSLLVRLALTITSLMIAISAPVSGLLVDRIGRRPLLLTGLMVYAISGTAGYFVTDLYVLLATRAVLGLAIGAIMTAVSTTITDWFYGQQRASFLGLQQASASLGGVVFLPLAGALVAINWRLPFWLYGLAAVVAVFAIVAIPQRPRDMAEPGTAREPVVLRPVLGIYLLALVATAVFYMAPTQVPFLLERLGAGSAVVGLVVAASTVSSTVGALTFPVLRRRLRSNAITTSSIALFGVGWLVVGGFDTVLGVTAGLLIGGAGVGLAVPNLNLRLSELAPPAWRGRVLSGLVAAIFLGQFLSPLVLYPLIQSAGVGAAFTWTGITLTAGVAVAIAGARKRNTA